MQGCDVMAHCLGRIQCVSRGWPDHASLRKQLSQSEERVVNIYETKHNKKLTLLAGYSREKCE